MEIHNEKVNDNFLLNRRALQSDDDSSCQRKAKNYTTRYTIAQYPNVKEKICCFQF